MEAKLKHLEMLQNIIARMANNSFFIKGWCITLVSALLALGSQTTNIKLIFITLLPLIMFWLLDAYFLWKERLYRSLYVAISITSEDSINFSMDTSQFAKKTDTWARVAISGTVILFYGTIFFAIIIVLTTTIK
jgi:hypothetical protein